MKQELFWLAHDVHSLLVAASDRMFVHLIITYLPCLPGVKTNNFLKTKSIHELPLMMPIAAFVMICKLICLIFYF